MNVPKTLTAGDTWTWTESLSDYPAGTWTATAYFVSSAGAFNSAASASGTDHLFSIAAATTAAKVAGRYQWTIRVTDGTTVAVVGTGYVEVLPDPSGVARDTRSQRRQELDAINCFLLGNASTAQQSMAVNGRSISRWDHKELVSYRDRLEARVMAEEAGPNASRSRDIKVRFGRA